MIQKIRCANPNCRRPFVPDSHVKNQRYCGKEECLRLRKKRWHREKMKSDPDYRKNQTESQQCWMEQNRDYWRNYRAKNPAYAERNRLLQKGRDHKRRARLAKMDALSPKYFLIPQAYPFLAKKDSIDWMPFHGLGCTPKEAVTHDGESHPLPRPGP